MLAALLVASFTGFYVFMGAAGFALMRELDFGRKGSAAVGVFWPFAFPVLFVAALNSLLRDRRD